MATTGFYFTLLLSAILAAICSGDGAIVHENPNGQNSLDIILSKLTDYFVPLENCTMMVCSPDKLAWGTKRPTYGPIILLEYDSKISLVTGRMIHNTFSVLRRRNRVAHCWATLAILPEKAGLLLPTKYYIIVNMPSFIYSTLRSHYFIIMTETKHEKPTFEMEPSEDWYQIDCAASECFDLLVLLIRRIGRLNKYFWANRGTHDANLVSNLVNLIDIRSRRPSRYSYQQIAELTSFHGFLCFLIQQDVMMYGLANFTPFHYFDPLQKMSTWGLGRHDFVMHDVQKYSFVSCYGVRGNSPMLGTLSSPFDGASWALIGTSFVVVALILWFNRNLTDGVSYCWDILGELGFTVGERGKI
ncbi:hypothetical protein Fcan01_19051 [Folsomia candida]|uniref:Uncharacterized protein n=1 Tax=Folsomia candida TaxID=158441 RepID=A0A226DM74_FOLCA|nr:hypothetical protein Fcan01_19051 [Folsomia candida]